MFGKQNRKACTLIVRKRKSTAFTLIELLVVVAIIALLVSIMVPAVQKAMDIAKNAVVKTQFHNIGIGAEMFKNDRLAGNGDYPDSTWTSPIGANPPPRPGHVSLPIQLIGRDLRGYDPSDLYDNTNSDSFRVGPYIKRESAEFINLDGSGNPGDARPVMLCKWGEPILYFSAKPGSTAENTPDEVYEPGDILGPIYAVKFNLIKIAYWGEGTDHSDDALVDDGPDYDTFYDAITNESLEDEFGLKIPYRGDSFILWSAGKDKEYGTEDDVTNFN